MKFEKTEVFNFEGAFRGMRNPMNSWDKSDSKLCRHMDCELCEFNDEDADGVEVGAGTEFSKHNYIIGKNDMGLAQRLILAGGEHRKFLRQIFVSVDITAPLYWWKEFDTYKIGTVSNSTSTMHKLASTQITLDCFERNELTKRDNYFINYINHLETLRRKYLKTNDKDVWKSLIQQLPESWLQTRTTTMNYENLRSIYFQRIHHKLTEWNDDFINWIKTLPYANELICLEGKGE